MDKKTKKYCEILSKLEDQVFEIGSCFQIASVMAADSLAEKYKHQCYHTQVIVQEDLTATINQRIKKDNLTDEGFPSDDYCPIEITGLPESKSWNLSNHEVCTHLTSIISPWFEDYLSIMKQGIDVLLLFDVTYSSAIEALGLLKLAYERGGEVLNKYKQRNDPVDFIDDFEMYLACYCNEDEMGKKFEELQMRMGIEQVKQKKDKPSIVKDKFSFPLGQVLYEGKDLKIPTGEALDVLKKLVDKFDSVVPYQDLEPSSVNSATEVLRGIVQKINQQFILHEIPCFISSKRTFGYILSAPKIPHFKKL